MPRGRFSRDHAVTAGRGCPPAIHFLSTVDVAFGAKPLGVWILRRQLLAATHRAAPFSDAFTSKVQNYFAADHNPFMVKSGDPMALPRWKIRCSLVAAISALRR